MICFFRLLPGTTFSDALIASYAMATDASKWDINMLLSMCNDQRFKPEDITFTSADALLESITDIVKVVCLMLYHMTLYDIT